MNRSIAIFVFAAVAIALASPTIGYRSTYYQYPYPAGYQYGPGYNYGSGYRGYSVQAGVGPAYQPYYQPYYSASYYGPSYYPYVPYASKA